jgi:hypothetical protein
MENVIQQLLYNPATTSQNIVDALNTAYDANRIDTLKRVVINYQKSHASSPPVTPIIQGAESLLNAL